MKQRKLHLPFVVVLALIVLTSCSALAISATNLATSATANASSIYGAGYEPQRSIDGNITTRWNALNNGTSMGYWFDIDWGASAKTFNTVVIRNYQATTNLNRPITLQRWDAGSNSFVDVSSVVPSIYLTVFRFPSITTTKIRLIDVYTFWEAEVYNLGTGIEGQVTTLYEGVTYPVSSVSVTAGDMTVETDCNGRYFLPVDPGSYTVSAVKNYQYASGSATVTDGAVSTVNMQVSDYNLARAGVATASTTDPTTAAQGGADGTVCTQWKATAEDTDQWFQIAWASPKTVNTVIIRFYDDWVTYPTQITVEADVDGSWQTVATFGDGTTNIPTGTLITLPSPVTTSKLRISKVPSLSELEVYECTEVLGMTSGINPERILGCVNITGGISPVISDGSGMFTLTAPVNATVTLRATADSYDDLVMDPTTITPGAYLFLQLSATAGNLTRTATSATASHLAAESQANYAIDGDPCTMWDAGIYHDGVTSIEIEWATAQTVDTVKIKRGSAASLYVDVWKNGGWMNVAAVSIGQVVFPATVSFDPRSTTKVRIRSLTTAREIEIYNLKGTAVPDNLTGTVVSELTGKPVVGAVVKYGNQTALTSTAGEYFMSVTPGQVNLEIARTGYEPKTATVTVAPTGVTTFNAILQTRNVAPIATAWASTEYPGGYEAFKANDDDFVNGRWSQYGEPMAIFELTWENPVTLNEIRVHQFQDYQYYLEVQYPNGENWVKANRVEFTTGMPVISCPVPPVPVQKIRLRGCLTIHEVEALISPSLTAAEVGDLKSLPDLTPVQLTGAVTAVFPTYQGYVEALDRSSAIKVIPSEKFGFTYTPGTENLARLPGVQATAYDYYQNRATYAPDKAIDGLMNTRYSTWGAGVDKWFQLTWPEPQTFNMVKIYHNGGNLNRDLRFQIPDGLGGWRTVGRVLNGLDNMEIVFPTVTTNQLRLVTATSFFEFEVYNGTFNASAVPTNKEVTITGTVTTVGGERTFVAGTIVPGDDNALGALAMPGKSLAVDSTALQTSPLLVTVWGRVTKKIAFGETQSYLYINDGSDVPSGIDGIFGVRVGPVATTAAEGSFIRATGIAGTTTVGSVAVRTVTPRSATDVTAM